MNKKMLRSKASGSHISSLDLNSNETTTFCFTMGFGFNFVSRFFETTGNAYCNVCKHKVVLPLA